jgi:hypothetical protein
MVEDRRGPGTTPEIQVDDPPRLEREGAGRQAEHWLVLLGAFSGIVLLAVFAFLVEPDQRGFGTHEKLGLPSCKMMEWFHVPCPGCGVTTSVALAARGRVWDSIRNQPFGLIVALSIPLAVAWAVRGHFRGRDLYRDLNAVRLGPWAIWLGAALAISWAYKIALVLGAFGRPAV